MPVNFDLLKVSSPLAKPVRAGDNIQAEDVVGNEISSGMLRRFVAGSAVATNGTATITNTGALGTFGAAVVPALNNTFDIDVTVNGVLRQVAVVIAVGHSFTVIAASIQAALRVLTGALETVAIVGGVFVFGTQAAGIGQTITLAAGTAGSAGGDLLAAIDGLGADYVTALGAVAGTNGIYNRVYVSMDALDNTLGANGVLQPIGGLRYVRVYGRGSVGVVDFDALVAADVEKDFYGLTANSFSITPLGPAVGRILKVYSATRAEVEFY